MKKYESYLLREPVFETNVALIVNCSFADLKKWDEARRHPDEAPLEEKDEANGLCYASRNTLGENCFVVYVKTFDWTVPCMGVLTHELTHLIFRICDYKNIPIRLENEEVFSYLLEYYQKQALQKLRRSAPQKKHGKRTKTSQLPLCANPSSKPSTRTSVTPLGSPTVRNGGGLSSITPPCPRSGVCSETV